MSKCLWCDKDFESKSGKAKFCSTSHRVMYHRKYGKKKGVTETQMQVLYNAMLDMVGKINFQTPAPAAYDGAKLPKNFVDDEPLSFDKLRQKTVQTKPIVNIQLLMAKYWEDKRECSNIEDYAAWLGRLESDDRLTEKQREILKTTNQ